MHEAAKMDHEKHKLEEETAIYHSQISGETERERGGVEWRGGRGERKRKEKGEKERERGREERGREFHTSCRNE
jgi:hypothetical protein